MALVRVVVRFAFVMACGTVFLTATVVAAASALALADLERVMVGSRGLMVVSLGFLLSSYGVDEIQRCWTRLCEDLVR